MKITQKRAGRERERERETERERQKERDVIQPCKQNSRGWERGHLFAAIAAHKAIVPHVLLTQIPAACYISKGYGTQKRFESKMNFCTVSNITVLVSSEKSQMLRFNFCWAIFCWVPQMWIKAPLHSLLFLLYNLANKWFAPGNFNT